MKELFLKENEKTWKREFYFHFFLAKICEIFVGIFYLFKWNTCSQIKMKKIETQKKKTEQNP